MRTNPWEETDQALVHYREESLKEMMLEYEQVMKLALLSFYT